MLWIVTWCLTLLFSPAEKQKLKTEVQTGKTEIYGMTEGDKKELHDLSADSAAR
jgi:hypothetical protein